MPTLGITGSGTAGTAVARLAAAADIDAVIAISRGPQSLAGPADDLTRQVKAVLSAGITAATPNSAQAGTRPGRYRPQVRVTPAQAAKRDTIRRITRQRRRACP